MGARDKQHAPTQARPAIVVSLVEDMLEGLDASARRHGATTGEILGALFTATLRMIKAMAACSPTLEIEFHNRAEMTKMCERLWVIAAGEPFKGDRKPS